jgi:hypothetical protein
MIGQPRSTQRYRMLKADDEETLTERIVAAASEYVATGIGGKLCCCARKAGWSTTSG